MQGGWSEYFATGSRVSRSSPSPFASSSSTGKASSSPRQGVEGSLIYAVFAQLRDEIAAQGSATFALDLLPARSAEQVLAEVAHPRGSRSLSSHLKSRLSLDGIKMALRELLPKPDLHDAARWPARSRRCRSRWLPRPIDEAISTAEVFASKRWTTG